MTYNCCQPHAAMSCNEWDIIITDVSKYMYLWHSNIMCIFYVILSYIAVEQFHCEVLSPGYMYM